MLEVGGALMSGLMGAAVLRDGATVGTLRLSPWRQSATADVAGREWVYTSGRRELTGRLAAEPEGTARLRAWPTSFWRIRWAVAESGIAGDSTPRPTLSAVDAMPLEHQMFLLWVGMVLDRRYASDGGAGGGGESGDGGGD